MIIANNHRIICGEYAGQSPHATDETDGVPGGPGYVSMWYGAQVGSFWSVADHFEILSAAATKALAH